MQTSILCHIALLVIDHKALVEGNKPAIAPAKRAEYFVDEKKESQFQNGLVHCEHYRNNLTAFGYGLMLP